MQKKNESLEWLLSAAAGSFVAALSIALGLEISGPTALWMTFPFLGLLLAIALTPLINPKWWHSNYPDVALFLGSLVATLYALEANNGLHKLLHSAHEYFAFMALIGGLFFVVSCIELEIQGKAGPSVNTLLLFCGAVLANFLGTTGASLLLIRPFIKLNRGRIKPMHIVFFIVLISNCGGALTPIGDPPLYLGYLKGVPFNWTLTHLFPYWSFVVFSLLLCFFCYDFFIVGKNLKQNPIEKLRIRIKGHTGVLCLFLMIVAIFIDPLLLDNPALRGMPISAMAQVIIAASCFLLTSEKIKQANEFTYEPFKEVALIFAGIFATMIPAMDYLAVNGHKLGLHSPASFYFATGFLSAFLDNAPTYLNFLQVAISDIYSVPTEISRESVATLIASDSGNLILVAISLGAVFFGAMSYIGNGPNFMVRSISESMNVKTPSFFGYIARVSLILLPILILNVFLLNS